MKVYKKIIPFMLCKDGNFITEEGEGIFHNDVLTLGKYFSNLGADELLIYEESKSDKEHDQNIRIIKELGRVLDIPFLLGGTIKRFEDVKKFLYAGAETVFLDASEDSHVDLLKEVSDRFGSDRIAMYIKDAKDIKRMEEFTMLGASKFIIAESALLEQFGELESVGLPVILLCEKAEEALFKRYFTMPYIYGVSVKQENSEYNWMELKQRLKESNLPVEILESRIKWEDFKLNVDGLIPVIVQESKTDEVLMLAYMNEKAFVSTIQSGKMTYFSRSRQKLWMKGETSGHVQYVKSLRLDCDNDTILAKVVQTGSACHTGSHNCFFQPLLEKSTKETNPLKVFEDVYGVIQDRKVNPKEGSYTNYLFDKGIDKILKKIGEEATEIIIAAKNPDPEEIKYEISDFLYHMMVLMAEKGVSWEEIMKELATR